MRDLLDGEGLKVKIAFMCPSGSPIGVTPPDVYGRGVGGAELALVSLAETLAGRGHDVVVYNDPRVAGEYDGVRYEPIRNFTRNLDALILFRATWPGIHWMNCPVIFFSCDQHTDKDYAEYIFPYVNHTVCISPYHRDYHIKRYGVDEDRISYIDLGVRLQDYATDLPKIAGRCIYCSVPNRGLMYLRATWPLIKQKAPHASLVITADYRLWGDPRARDEEHRAMWAGSMDVQYLGKIPREELCKEQLRAEVMTFPCTYEELFCISAAECQVAGAIPVTSVAGALPTTVEAGVKIDYPVQTPDFLDMFVRETVDLLMNGDRRHSLQGKARVTRARFDWERIAGEWEGLIISLLNRV